MSRPKCWPWLRSSRLRRSRSNRSPAHAASPCCSTRTPHAPASPSMWGRPTRRACRRRRHRVDADGPRRDARRHRASPLALRRRHRVADLRAGAPRRAGRLLVGAGRERALRRVPPCQVLADLQTIIEHKGTAAGLTMAYLGDGANNMGALVDARRGYRGHARARQRSRRLHPGSSVLAASVERARLTGGSATVISDPVEAVRGADVLVTDTWVSMGQGRTTGRTASHRLGPTRSTTSCSPTRPKAPSCCTACPHIVGERSPTR